MLNSTLRISLQEFVDANVHFMYMFCMAELNAKLVVKTQLWWSKWTWLGFLEIKIPHCDGNFIMQRAISAELFHDFYDHPKHLTRELEQFHISLISHPAI